MSIPSSQISELIMTLRGCCELSSRKVFLFARSCSVGCTLPVASVTRETSVCSPGVARSSSSEQLPAVFRRGRRIHRRRLPRAVVDLHFDRLDRRAVVQHDHRRLVRLPFLVTRATNDFSAGA